MTLPTVSATPRIAHVISGLTTGGAEMMLLKLVRGGERRFSHDVISLSTAGTVGPLLEQAGARVHALNLKPGTLPTFNALDLVRLLNRLQPNIIQGWMYHGNVAASCARMFMKRRPALSWSVRCSLNDSESEKWLTRGVVKVGAILSRRPSAIIYNSHLSRAQHKSTGYSDRHATVIPNGFDTGAFQIDAAARDSMRRRSVIPSNSFVVGLIARNHPMKDHRTFFAAAIKVSRARSDVTFVAAGSDIPRLAESMQDLVGELGPRLILLPEQSNISVREGLRPLRRRHAGCGRGHEGGR